MSQFTNIYPLSAFSSSPRLSLKDWCLVVLSETKTKQDDCINNLNLSFLYSLQSYCNFPRMHVSSVLHQPYSLPSTQTQTSSSDWYIDTCSTQHTFNMGRHIIRSLAIMLIQSFSLWNQFVENILHIFLNSRIIILAKSKASRSMMQKYVAKTHFKCRQFLMNRGKDLISNKVTSPLP